LAGASLVAAAGAGYLFFSTAHDAWISISAAGPADPADGLLLVVAALGAVVSLWLGLGLDTAKEDMMQAVLEGVALRASEVMEVMARQGGRGTSISIDGGLSQNPYFGQFLANALNRRVLVSSSADLTGLGVARMAMLGAGAKSLPPLPKPTQAYLPLEPLPASLHSRFGIAVLRAKGWKGF